MQSIGIFFGSQSPEHDVSIITAELIIAELKKMSYPVVPVYIGKAGEWYIAQELGELKFFTNENQITSLPSRSFHRYFLDLEKSRGKLVFKKKGLGGKEVIVDLAFPALHGSFGEDGTIQGLFEMCRVPYVGCDVTASAIAMDKVLTKLLYQAWHIPTTKFVYFTKDEWANEREGLLGKIRHDLTAPVFVKPARLGSSIGIAKVKNMEGDDLSNRIEVALHYDTKVLVEEGIENVMDITCAVLDTHSPQASLLQESIFQSDLFDFDEKYLKDSGAQLGQGRLDGAGQGERGVVIPARLDEKTTTHIRELAVKIFNQFGCSGIARVDFLFNKTTNTVFANEVNTMPGTLYHHLWKASGLELSVVIKKLLDCAHERQAERKQLRYTFPSTLLQQARSIKLMSK